MENATKALIMAGAILIAILLISTGIIVIRSTSGVEEQVNSTSGSMAVSTFNSQFTQYVGTNIPAVQVKSLLSTIQASNSKSNHTVSVTMGNGFTSTNPANAMNQLTASYYNVSIKKKGVSGSLAPESGYDDNGYITSINITPAGSTPVFDPSEIGRH